jgi:hypothetical protein
LFIATGGFQHNKSWLMLLQEVSHLADALRIIIEAPGDLVMVEGEIEMIFGDIDASKRWGLSGHGWTSLCILFMPALVRYGL